MGLIRTSRFRQAIFVCFIVAVGTRPSDVFPEEQTTPADLKTPVRITGRVIEDVNGDPAAGAEVFVLLPAPGGGRTYYWPLPLKRTKANENGEFAYETSRSGRHLVWASLGKLTSRNKTLGGEKVVVDADGTSPEAIELRVRPAVTVRVMVSDEADGRLLSNATVHLGWSDLDDFQTDEDGAAKVEPLPQQRCFFEVWAEGYAKQAHWLNLEAGNDAELATSLRPGGVVEGVVRGPDGQPLAGAQVGASVVDKRDLHWTYQRTDGQGRYRIANLPLNEAIDLSVASDGYLRDHLKLSATEPTTHFDIKMTPRPHGGSVKGVVTDQGGEPIRGARLTNQGDHSADQRQATSDDNGRFLIDDLFHSFSGCQLAVSAKGFAPVAINVKPGPVDAPAELTIILEPGRRISGKVVDENGSPLNDVFVSWSRARFQLGGSTRTDEKGRFKLDSLPEGCALSFSKQGYSPLRDEQLPLDGEGTVNVVLSPQGVIRGKVIDARSDEPVRSFRVRVTFSPQRSPNDPRGGIRSELVEPGQEFQSDDGTFELSNLLLRMPLQVMVDAEGYERGVNERIESRAAEEAGLVVFRLTAEDPANLVAYRGRFVDSQGNPVAGAQLRLVAVDRRDAHDRNRFPFNWTMIRNGQAARQRGVRRFLQAATGKDGTFYFERIPGGADAELVWWGKGISPGRRAGLEKLTGREREAIQIVREPPALIMGKVDRGAFPEASQIVLSASIWGLMDHASVPLAEGQETFELPDLAAGKYTIMLMGPLKPAPRGLGMTSQQIDAVRVELKAGERKEIVLNGSREDERAPAKTR